MSSFSGNLSGSASLKSQEDIERWVSRIKNVQAEKGSPEIIQSLRQNADRQRSATVALNKANHLSRLNYVACASNAKAFEDLSETIKLPSSAERSAQFQMSSNVSGIRAMSIARAALPAASECMGSSRFSSKRNKGTDIDMTKTLENEEDEEELRTVEADLGINYATYSNNVSAVQHAAAIKVEENLDQLKYEPTDPDECTAKFSLFENASQTVSTIREKTLQFWEENQITFAESVQKECRREITSIDRSESMGIPDDAKFWFVYYMTKIANENSKRINTVLDKFKNRLDLLSRELCDCPFCLEPLIEDTVCTLSCCHRVCNDCWENWVQIKGNAAFCPLCMHTEFAESFF
eukprot:gene4644-9215_t